MKASKTAYSIEDITSSRDTSIWRYLPLLPVDDPGCEGTPLRAAGWTPDLCPACHAQRIGHEAVVGQG